MNDRRRQDTLEQEQYEYSDPRDGDEDCICEEPEENDDAE